MTLQSEILDGLDVANWDASIAQVKRVVSNALRKLDRTVLLEDTHYFNHTFVPDFVLSWPRDSARRPRDVYLRLDSSTSFIQRDLQTLDNEAPLLFSLTPDWSQQQLEDSGTPTREETKALVTEPQAVEQFGGASQNEFGQVVPAAVLRGGHGWVDASTAQDVTRAATDFFVGATDHEGARISGAVDRITTYLDPQEAGRILNFGRIIWEATGGEPSQYPRATDLSGLDDAGLRFLLEEGPAENDGFWRSVGRLVVLERLIQLGVSSPNLGELIRVNADRIYAKALLVKATQRTLDDVGPQWMIESGGLALRGSDFTIYFAPRRDLLTVAPDTAHPLTFDAFRRRTSDEQVETVTVVTLDNKTITIESDDIFDPSTDNVLASVGGLPGTRIAQVGLIVGGKHLACDFTSRSAHGHTNAQFDLLSLLERALPLLWPISDTGDLTEVR